MVRIIAGQAATQNPPQRRRERRKNRRKNKAQEMPMQLATIVPLDNLIPAFAFPASFAPFASSAVKGFGCGFVALRLCGGF
jgi:hypothetical protein